MPDWTIDVYSDGHEGIVCVRWNWLAYDADKKRPKRAKKVHLRGEEILIGADFADSSIIHRLWWSFGLALEHEAAEFFTVDGKKVHDPHKRGFK